MTSFFPFSGFRFTRVTPASSGSASLSLTWEDNSAIEDGYRLRYRTAGSGSYTLGATTAANATSGTITGLSYGTNYDVTVAAFNTSGEYSVVGPVTRYTPPQYAPTSISATTTLSTSITVGFTAAAGVTSYQGYYRATGSSTWLIGPAITSGTNINFTGLASSTTYQFMVRGFFANADPQTPSYSPDSAAVSATTTVQILFSPVGNIGATQGVNGWSFGQAVSPFTPAEFTTTGMTFADNQWQGVNQYSTPHVSATGVTPGYGTLGDPRRAAARKFVCPSAGSAIIAGTYNVVSPQSQSGIGLSVYKNSTLLQRFTSNSGTPVAYSINTTLAVNDVVYWIVDDMDGNWDWDASIVTGTVEIIP